MPRDAACRCASPGSNAAQRATSASANWLLGVEHRRGGAARRGSGGLVAAPCRVAAAARSVYAMPPRTASLCCSRAEHLRAGKPGLPHRATRPNSACAAAMSSTSGQWMTPMTASTLRCACRSAMRVRRRASSSFGGGGGLTTQVLRHRLRVRGWPNRPPGCARAGGPPPVTHRQEAQVQRAALPGRVREGALVGPRVKRTDGVERHLGVGGAFAGMLWRGHKAHSALHQQPLAGCRQMVLHAAAQALPRARCMLYGCCAFNERMLRAAAAAGRMCLTCRCRLKASK